MFQKNSKLKVVITGITGLRNHGVEALVGTACAQLRRIFPERDITVLTLDQTYDRYTPESTANKIV